MLGHFHLLMISSFSLCSPKTQITGIQFRVASLSRESQSVARNVEKIQGDYEILFY
jgi:hypothetical protein